MPTITVQSASGNTYHYNDNGTPMQGGMKDVYFAPDKSYVVAFFRDNQDMNRRLWGNISKRKNAIIFKYDIGFNVTCDHFTK